MNVVRLSLDPGGLAPRIVNLPEWRAHLVGRLRREHDASGDVRLLELAQTYDRTCDRATRRRRAGAPGLVVPFVLRQGPHELSFLSTTTVFGTTREVTLSELAIETFYPADAATRSALGVGAQTSRMSPERLRTRTGTRRTP